jgi:hypothetical protein
MRLPASLQLIIGVSFGTIVFLAIVWSVWWLGNPLENTIATRPVAVFRSN